MPKRCTEISEKLNRCEKVGDCIEFRGSINNRGYGKFNFKGKVYLAHRASYEYKYGAIPENMMICHKCNNRKCINPEHLYCGSMAQNARDRSKHISERKILNKKYGKNTHLNIRISPDLHFEILRKCQDEKKGLQEYVIEILTNELTKNKG